jgi:hypothetical protein
MQKPVKTKKIKKGVNAPAAPLNDGTNTPVPDQRKAAVLSAGEADLYKQAENPLGDPHKP